LNIKHEVEVLQNQIARLAMEVNALKAAACKNEIGYHDVTDLYAPEEERGHGPRPLYEVGQFVFDIRCLPAASRNTIPYQITSRMFDGKAWTYRVHDFIENNPPDSSTGYPEARLCGAGDWYACNHKIMREFYAPCGDNKIMYIDRAQNTVEPAWCVNCHKIGDKIFVDSVELYPVIDLYASTAGINELYRAICQRRQRDAQLLKKELLRLDRWLAHNFPEEIR